MLLNLKEISPKRKNRKGYYKECLEAALAVGWLKEKRRKHFLQFSP